MHVVSLSGSPSARSRSNALLQWAGQQLQGSGATVHAVALRELDPAALLAANAKAPGIAAAVAQLQRADVVLVGTPVYKAAYSGLLKVFLDLLPSDALRGKTVLPLATGGGPAHGLALDLAIKPVLSVLGAQAILDGVYATEAQFTVEADGPIRLDDALAQRLSQSLQPLQDRLAAAAAARCPA